MWISLSTPNLRDISKIPGQKQIEGDTPKQGSVRLLLSNCEMWYVLLYGSDRQSVKTWLKKESGLGERSGALEEKKVQDFFVRTTVHFSAKKMTEYVT